MEGTQDVTPTAIEMLMLRHTVSYWIGTEIARFKAEQIKVSGFNCVMALFTFADGRELKIIRLPLNKGYDYSEPIDFNIEYKLGAWYANINQAF